MELDTEIILTYCVCDDYLKEIYHKGDSSLQMNNAEVLTWAIVSGLSFYGNHKRTRAFLKESYIPNILSESQLNRRIHAFDLIIWQGLLDALSKAFKKFETSEEYIVDSFPISVCDTPRISRCKIYSEEKYRGYNASKKRYFYGIKVHMLTYASGFPKEVSMLPGSIHDMKAFKELELDLPEGSIIYGDKAYTSYDYEDFLLEHVNIKLIAERRKYSKRPMRQEVKFVHNIVRKRIETTFSRILRLFPRSLNVSTAKGFKIKVFSFIIAFAMRMYFKKTFASA